MEYYSTIERNKIVPFAKMWMDLETIILSEVSQKNKYILMHICVIWGFPSVAGGKKLPANERVTFPKGHSSSITNR